MKRDNEQLVDTLHREQDKSYKLLRDLHQQMQEGKQMKQAIEEMRNEVEIVRSQERRWKEVEEENLRVKAEIGRMQAFVNE